MAMKLQLKFSLIFLIVFGLGLAVTGYVCNGFLQGTAREQVLQQARLMMESSMSSRTYTNEQIKPLVAAIPEDPVFRPQTVPAYAATENFNYLRAKYPEYTYKEATINPTNLRDRAVEWETDIISYFRDHPNAKEFSGERETPTGRSLYLSRPLRAGKACLICHSTPDVAPASMIKQYGSTNGFGWQENDVIGAQIVSVPMSVSVSMAKAAFRQLMTSLVGVMFVTLLILNLMLSLMVIRPVRKMATMADEISQGNLDVPELPVSGSDEISILGASFNRMHRSLAKAMKILSEQ